MKTPMENEKTTTNKNFTANKITSIFILALIFFKIRNILQAL